MPLRRFSAFFAATAALSCAVSASASIFEPLFMVTKIVGDARVVRPDGRSEALLVDHAYPYGSRIVVASALTRDQSAAYKAAGVEPEEPQVSFTMARDYRFRLSAGSDATLLDDSADDVERKVIDLAVGSVSTFITASSTKTGGAGDAAVEANLSAVVVRTPVGECTRLTQRNQVQVLPDPRDPSIRRCQFASQSGLMEISGPQYHLGKLKKNTVVDIEGSADFTSISAQYGEFTAEFEKGADAVEKAVFRTHCVGKIWRERAEISGRMAVSVMIAYPNGKLVTYDYLEGQTGVGSSRTANGSEGARPASPGAGIGDDATESAFGSDAADGDADDAPSSSGDSAGDSFDFGDW